MARVSSYDELGDAERQKVAQFAAGNAGGNANVSRALQALSANPAYALQMMQRAGIDIGQPDSTTSDSARAVNWSDTVDRSMQDGGADIAPGNAQTRTAPLPPVRPSNLGGANGGGRNRNAAAEEHTVTQPQDAPVPPRRPVELGGVAEPSDGDSGSMNGVIMAALAAAATQHLAKRMSNGRAPQMQLPPEAGGQQALPNRMQMLEGPPDPRLLQGPQAKMLPLQAMEIEDVPYKDVTPKNVEAEDRKALPKPEAKSTSEKTLDRSLDDGGQSKRKQLEAPVDDSGVERTLNRREKAAKAVRESTRKVKLKK